MTFIGHGLTPDTRAALLDGTMDVAITQDHQIMMLNCVRIFTNLRDGRAAHGRHRADPDQPVRSREPFITA